MTTPDELYEQLTRLGTDWADKNSAALLLKENKKSILAQVTLQYLSKSKTIKQAETMAEADGDYMKHIQNMVAAERASNIARVNYDAMRTYVDLYRTQQANERIAMGMR